ncbi:MAG TPA: V-type ATPase 116kDa subunit family protein [Bacillota bacterium]|nr:V-type ATPase 116kDa subunit family protein [Bacillota bacterium]HOK68533.1 V-type ATPase 116kDa subunit family protein [Bacillota bacterium]HPP86075.1 V-type ATPase 116kDa subunit family protein [Bacillota bacterium]
MAIAKVMLVKASGKLSELDKFIAACRKSGEFHPENTCRYLSGSMGFAPPNDSNPYSSTLQKIEELAAISGFQLTQTNWDEAHTPYDENVTAYIDEISAKLDSLYSDRKLLQEHLNECENGIAQFQHFIGLDVPIEETLSCEFVSVRYGRLPKEQMIKLKAYENNPYVLFIPCSSDEHNIWGVYFAPKDKADEVDRIFTFMFFERRRIPNVVGTPTEILTKLQENVDLLKQQIEAVDADIAKFWNENSSKCNEVYSRLKWLSESFEMRQFAAVKNGQFYYILWILKSNLKKFKSLIDEIGDITCEISEYDETGRIVPPVKLKNNSFFKSFESFVSMYGLPSYKDIDVTSFVAVTYTLIFGIMFADLGQGIVLALAGLILFHWKKIQFGKLLTICGLSSMFFGLMFGSFFGFEHLLDPLYSAVGLNGKPLHVMESINTVLLIGIGIGVALLIASMFLNVIVCFKRKAYGEALFDNNGLTGILVYIAGVLAVYSFMTGESVVSGGVILTVILIGVVIFFFKEPIIKLVDREPDWKPEKLSDYIMQNVFEVFEYFLSYFSNTVSFLRVGAFVLVHAGMMMVVFSLAGDSENLIVIALGNIFVIALEGLLSGIQVLRLEFYEMFSRCYDGGGRPFISAEQAVSQRAK